MRNRGAARTVVLVAALFVGAACASDPQIRIPGPLDRYDHNRSHAVTAWEYHVPGERPVVMDENGVVTEGEPGPDAVVTLALSSPPSNAAYAARAASAFPHTVETGADGLHHGRLVPLFVGVPLPLDDAPVTGPRLSDRADLVRYLGRGPFENVGVQDKSGAGALTADVVSDQTGYGLVLRMLASPADLASRTGFTAWAERHGADTTQQVDDPRLRAGGFDPSRTIAVRWREFWFVLFALPPDDAGSHPYSRLVVVPIRDGVKPSDKKPGNE